MEKLIPLIAVAVIAILAYRIHRKAVAARREKLIDNYAFPQTLTTRLLERYPHLTEQDAMLVIAALRDYFHICNSAGKRMVSMPSQAVDVVWHEFILFTRKYERFCNQAVGRFLHHTPAEAMKAPTLAQEGIKRAWKYACLRDNIKPDNAHKLPLIFAIDAQLNIPDGFRYSLNCTGRDDYCAGHIGCSSGCGGDSASSDSASSDSGCGGGCGGD